MIKEMNMTLALIELFVWLKARSERASLALSVLAISVAAFAGLELALMRAQTPEQLGEIVRWLHVPAWVMITSLVAFTHLYLRAGRLWLAWMVVGVRTLSLIINFVFSPNINFREITAARHISFLEETVSVPAGVPNPWMLVAQLSLVLLVIFVIDAAIAVWKRGDRREALVVGGSIVFFVVIASAQAIAITWVLASAGNADPLNNVTWELYDLTKDYSQSEDLAAKNPAKVKELAALFLSEAKKYQVLPLDSSVATRVVAPRPNITAGRSEFVYTTLMTGLPLGDSPSLLNTSYTVSADLTVTEGGAEGMIVTCGGRFAGYGFYLLKGKPVWNWNLFGLKHEKWEAPDALTPGKHMVEFDFKYDGLGGGTLAFNNMSGIGQGGTGVLKVDGKEVVTHKMEHTIPIILQFDESFDIGSDTLTGVDEADYKVPFPLTAKLNKLTIKIDRPQLSPEDIKKLEDGMLTAKIVHSLRIEKSVE